MSYAVSYITWYGSPPPCEYSFSTCETGNPALSAMTEWDFCFLLRFLNGIKIDLIIQNTDLSLGLCRCYGESEFRQSLIDLGAGGVVL